MNPEVAKSAMERGLAVERRKPVRLEYLRVAIEGAFRVDLLVERRVVVELKPVQELAPVHPKKFLTHVKLSQLQGGC